MQRKNFKGGQRRQGQKGQKRSFGNSQRSFGGFQRDRGPREMHKVTCADCGNECEVPFKPTEGKPVYCRDCYQKRRKF